MRRSKRCKNVKSRSSHASMTGKVTLRHSRSDCWQAACATGDPWRDVGRSTATGSPACLGAERAVCQTRRPPLPCCAKRPHTSGRTGGSNAKTRHAADRRIPGTLAAGDVWFRRESLRWSRGRAGACRDTREPSGLADRAVSSRRRLAQAAARHPPPARWMDLGIVRRGLRRESRPHLDRHAWRIAFAGRRQALDAVRGAQSHARQRQQQHGRSVGDLRAGGEAGMGAAMGALDLRRRPARQSRPGVAASREAVQPRALRARTAPDQDQSLRP
jgi:hypothetical protein